MSPIQYPDNLYSKFKFIAIAAQRCRQLQKGARPRIASRSKKYTTVAQEEVLAGTVTSYDGPVPEEALEALDTEIPDGPVSAD